MLSKFLRGNQPLFHAASGANAKGLLKYPKVLTATEGIARGLIDNIEAGSTAGRHSVRDVVTNAIRPRLSADSAVVDLKDVAARTEHFLPATPLDLMAGVVSAPISDMRYGGDVADYAKHSLIRNLTQQAGAGKNWSSLWFMRGKPLRSYGAFGVMTTPERVRGELTKIRRSDQVAANPLWTHGKDGMPESLELPTATGKIFYHPTLENADLARQFQQTYGKHNVIPWSNRLSRRINSMDLIPFTRESDELGNIGWSELEKRFPSAEADRAEAKGIVINWMQKHIE